MARRNCILELLRRSKQQELEPDWKGQHQSAEGAMLQE